MVIAQLSACGDGAGENAVAHVGSAAITKTTLDHWASVGLADSGQRGVGQGTRTRQALGVLISAEQLLGEADVMHVAVSDKEAEARLEEVEWNRARGFKLEPAAHAASFAEQLGRTGETRSDRLLLVKLDLLAAKVEGKLLSQVERGLSQAEIASYYAAHKQRYMHPERRTLEVIGNYDKSVVVKAKREVEAGANFLEIAKRVSIDQEAPGGLEPPLARGEEEPTYDKVVFVAKPGRLYGPYRQAFYYIFKILKITPARQISLASSDAKIKGEIAAERRRRISSQFQRAMEQRWTARTDCKPGYVVPRCRQYVARASVGEAR